MRSDSGTAETETAGGGDRTLRERQRRPGIEVGREWARANLDPDGNAEGFHKIQNIDAYQHDGLHRLTKVDYNRSATMGDEVYVYDSLGNRVTYTDHRNATTRAYANNLAKEYTSVATFAVTHDVAGNLSKQGINGDGDIFR